MIGRTIRSAKMNAITPPKLIPPDQSTAASGTFPTEQTKERTAISGPTITFSTAATGPEASDRKSVLKKSFPSRPTNPARRKPSDDLLPQHLPVAAEVVGDVRPGRGARQPLAQRELLAGRVVLVAGVGLLGVAAGRLLEPG